MARRSLSSHADTARRQLAARRFGVLDTTLIATIAAVMILTPLAHVALQFLISVPLFASLYVLSSNLRAAAALGGAIAILSLLAVLFTTRGDTWLLITDVGLRTLVIGGITWWIGTEVLSEVRVSLDTILGGICIYLLLGFFYAHIYLMLELADVGALLESGRPLASLETSHPLHSVPSIVYYSYATVTTVAYGDITPATPLARFVAMSEAMIGQLFPTIFIARLVSLNVAQIHSSEG
jgi:Ion channel